MSADNTAGPAPAGKSGIHPFAVDLVKAIGLIVNNTLRHCWLSKYDAASAVKDGFGILERSLKELKEITFAVREDAILVNGLPLDEAEPLAAVFGDQVKALGISSVTLSDGLDRNTFEQFLDILTLTPEELSEKGGFSTEVKNRGLANVTARNVVYQEVAEDEIVVSRDRVKAGEALDKEVADRVVACMRGDADIDPASVAGDMRRAASDPKTMADLVMRSAEARREANAVPGESFPEAVTACLRRMFEVVSTDESVSTQTGKRRFSRELGRLEQEIQNRFGELPAPMLEGGGAKQVVDTLVSLADELMAQVLMTDFARGRKANAESEDRLAKFVREKGFERIKKLGLRERLREMGIEEAAWGELLSAGESGGAAGVEAAGRLAELLSSLEQRLGETGDRGRGEPAEKVADTLTAVADEVNGLVAAAEQKIRVFVRDVQRDEAAINAGEKDLEKSGVKLRMSRKRMLTVLAEIVQELCQPLSVINCTLDMVLGGQLGPVPDLQSQMLRTASEGVGKIGVLVENIRKIAGEPESATVDTGIQEMLYR